MATNTPAASGRRLLLASLPGIALLAAAGFPLPAKAAKASKRDVYYQDQPKDGKRCATCRQYIASAEGEGSCALVEGPVSAAGWCLAYSPRNPT